MTEVAAAGAPALAQNAIIHVIDFADDAIARNDATRKAEAFRLVKVLIKSAAAGTISFDAAKCDHVECLVQTLHLSALAAEVDEEAKGASRLEMQQLRATILRMKASTPSTAVAHAANKQNGRWSKQEHQQFLDLMEVHGRSWTKIARCMDTRTEPQDASGRRRGRGGDIASRRGTRGT